jgi:hypothetical protein
MLNSNHELVAAHDQLDAASRALGLVDVSSEGDIIGIDLRSLLPGTTLTVETCNSRYQLTKLEGSGGHVLVQGGSFFSERSKARVDGSTAGGSLIKIGWIGVGLHLEIAVGRRRFVTSPVRSISVEGCAPDTQSLNSAEQIAS